MKDRQKDDGRRIVLQMRCDFVGDCGSIWMCHSETSAVEFEMLLWWSEERIYWQLEYMHMYTYIRGMCVT